MSTRARQVRNSSGGSTRSSSWAGGRAAGQGKHGVGVCVFKTRPFSPGSVSFPKTKQVCRAHEDQQTCRLEAAAAFSS